ncbi:MAG: MOSC domain-containing protein [Bacteroidota bacterium]
MSKPSLNELMNTLPQVGSVEWIGIRPERRAALQEVQEVKVTIEGGLEGDHYAGKREKKRQITLIQGEHLDLVSSVMKKDVHPEDTRRNLVIRGINLLSLKEKQFTIGDVVLEMTGLCHPCSRMEENLGPGGYNAMRGHGGINARVIQGGTIKAGDAVKMLA